MTPEHINDLPYEEHIEYAEIICNAFTQTEIENLEAVAEVGFLD